jgi:hypothetical protein
MFCCVNTLVVIGIRGSGAGGHTLRERHSLTRTAQEPRTSQTVTRSSYNQPMPVTHVYHTTQSRSCCYCSRYRYRCVGGGGGGGLIAVVDDGTNRSRIGLVLNDDSARRIGCSLGSMRNRCVKACFHSCSVTSQSLTRPSVNGDINGEWSRRTRSASVPM